jgi:AraC-like DNA-binding protein
MPLNRVLFLSAFFVALFALTELLLEKRKTDSRKFVILILVMIPLSFCLSFIQAPTPGLFSHMLSYNPLRHWTFLLGPLLYYYQSAATGQKLEKKDFLHLVPFILWYGSSLFLFHGVLRFSSDMKRFYGITTLFSFAFYSSFILIRLHLHKKGLGERLSYRDFYLELEWMQYIMVALLVITLFLGIVIPLNRILGPLRLTKHGRNPNTVLLFHSLATFAFIYFFSLFSLKQNRILHSEIDGLPLVEKEKGGGDEKGNAGENEAAYNDLVRYMNDTRLYLKSELNLQLLADSFSQGRNEVSRLINQATGENFFHFVNGFRAREFKKSLEEKRYPDYTLLSIGLECGFNSKSTFNEAVKREFGQTPSQLNKAIKN